ncbi:MAG: hypothetical protein ABI723_18535 [Bacteroidia bacterium]
MTDIQSKLTTADSKGTFLELIVEDIFKDLNFQNVRRQKSGSQYGYDVIGHKDNQCWKAECKNLNTEATINDIAPKLVWHIDSVSIDRFVIVSVNGISNDLYHLLEQKLFSFPIEIWCGDFLEKLICESPNALKRLGLSKPDTSEIQNSAPLIFPANELTFNVVYRGLPFSYDYFQLDDEVIKAYSEVDFRLTATIANKTNKNFIVQGIKVKTLKFENTNGLRVLRQYKQKGIITPLKLTFIPKQFSEGEVELLSKNLLEVKSNSNEFLEFKLSQKCDKGYYELIFEINCVEGGRTFSLYSPIFQLHKKSFKNDLLNLCVVGKYYDTPVYNILNLDDKTWFTIKREYPNCLKFLGPTDNDTVQEKESDKTWTINLLKGKRSKSDGVYSLDIKSSRQTKLLADLKIPIEEHIYTLTDVKREILG